MNRLAAWLLASGSVDRDRKVAAFVIDNPAVGERLVELLETFDLRVRIVDRDGRPPEYIPREDATVLGRVLQTWTGIDGDKSPIETRFPEYLQYAPVGIARGFAKTYVSLRASVRDDRDGRLQIQADRTDRFREQLVALFERVVSDPEDIRGDSWPVYIAGEVADQLFDETLADRKQSV